MLSTSPIFLRNSRTPSAGGPGVRLAEPSYRAGGAVWLHGCLTLPESVLPRYWPALAASLTLTLTTEPNQAAWSRFLVGKKPAPDAAFLEEPSPGGEILPSLPFHVDVARLLGGPLPRCAFFVHVSARERSSEAVRIPEAALRALSPGLEGPVERLMDALSSVAAASYEAALPAFAEALADPRIASLLDPAARYDAACAASLAASSIADVARRDAFVADGVAWLAADLRHASAVEKELAAEAAGGIERDRREARLALARKHLHGILGGDPDLAAIRAAPGWLRAASA